MVAAGPSEEISQLMCIKVNPGVCGFHCLITAQRIDKQNISVEITGSECKQIQRMSRCLDVITVKNLFAPISQNPVFGCAEKVGCHPSCIVPMAVLRLAEEAMGMALPRDVYIKFKSEGENR